MKRDRRYGAMVTVIAVVCLGLVACASTPMSPSKKAEQQDDIRDMAKTTLSKLYAQNPTAKDAIAKAAGYAVFSDFGFKVLFMGGAKGAGLAVDNATKQETFMKVAELQPGLA